MRQRRRLLKNRKYAKRCQKRIAEQQFAEENALLRQYEESFNGPDRPFLYHNNNNNDIFSLELELE